MILIILTQSQRDIFDIITALGVMVAAISLLLNVRANYISIINKCTSEFRNIVRIVQHEKLPKGYNMNIIIEDFCGLFNEQLYYMNWFYVPYSIKKEWKKSIIAYLIDHENGVVISEEVISNFERLYKFYQKQLRKRDQRPKQK